MKFTKSEIEEYHRLGYLLINNTLQASEIELLKQEALIFSKLVHEGKVLEKDKNTIRSLHGCHINNNIFNQITRHPKLLAPVMQLLNSQVYVHQFKINCKAAYSGDIWPWHQDFIYWKNEDGMPLPENVNVVIYLEDVNEFNGPIYCIPSSHHEGIIQPHSDSKQKQEGDSEKSWQENFNSTLKYTVPFETVSALVEKYGLVSLKAAAGSVLFFHSNMVHGSAPNISPYGRKLILITYNNIKNISSIENPRPEFISSRNNQPLKILSKSFTLDSKKLTTDLKNY